MRNFDYIKDIAALRGLYHYCNVAELTQRSAPDQSAINSRLALKWMSREIYSIKGLEVGERTSLLEMMEGEPFKEFVGNERLMMSLNYVRKVGQAAEHKGNESKKESFFALLTIYNFVGAVLVKLGVVESFPAFDKELRPER
ncbi:MAG: helicase, partial [Bacteroidales bacterium]|nr:helicase [Bacteroidales bacterium]